MNQHAKNVASNRLRCSQKFNDLFDKFIRLLVDSDFNQEYLQAGGTALNTAYWDFFNCVGSEVTASEDK